jgi:hypothetical protein
MTQANIMKCFHRPACIGGFHPLNDSPVECAFGYTGILCHACVEKEINGTRRFMRMGRSKCSLCPEQILNTLRILGLLFIILFLIFALIWFNIRKYKESESSILGKIFTNYVHTVTATVSFNVEYPQFVKDSFEPAQMMS